MQTVHRQPFEYDFSSMLVYETSRIEQAVLNAKSIEIFPADHAIFYKTHKTIGSIFL